MPTLGEIFFDLVGWAAGTSATIRNLEAGADFRGELDPDG